MKQIKTDYLHADLSKEVIHAFYKVYNTLGYGFLEKVYENALKIELDKAGLIVEVQKPITVYYDGIAVGYYVADMVINDLIIIENKAGVALSPDHENQLLNYLKATRIEVGLLLNFGTTPTFKRKIFENKYK